MTIPAGCGIMASPREVDAMASYKTQQRILQDARKIVRGEKVADFLNDPKQFFHRLRVGYYSDRLAYAARWLINDEQQQIDEYYGR